MPRQD